MKSQIEHYEQIYPLMQVNLIEWQEFEIIDAQFYDRCMMKFVEAFHHNRQTQAIRTLGLLTKLFNHQIKQWSLEQIWTDDSKRLICLLLGNVRDQEVDSDSTKWINQTVAFLQDEDHRCVICYYKLAHENKCRKLRSCDHQFYHQACIDKWLRYDIRCPTCRKYAR